MTLIICGILNVRYIRRLTDVGSHSKRVWATSLLDFHQVYENELIRCENSAIKVVVDPQIICDNDWEDADDEDVSLKQRWVWCHGPSVSLCPNGALAGSLFYEKKIRYFTS